MVTTPNIRRSPLVARGALLVIVLLAACNAAGAPPTSLTATIVRAPEPRATFTPPATPTRIAPQPPARPIRPQISLRADLDCAAHHLDASQVVTYPNRTGTALPYLALDVLAARRSGVFSLISARVHNDPAATWELDQTVLRVKLGEPLAANQAAVILVEYTLDLPPIPPGADGAAGALGWSSRQINLGDWFPAVSAYRAGWLAERNPPHVVGETTAPEAVDIALDLGVANAPDHMHIIASAPAEQVNGRYRFELSGARACALSLGADFEIAEMTTPSGVVVRSAYFPEHAEAGQAALRTSAAALEIYAARYGPYHYKQLALVEADFADGMEYSGFYFLGNEYYAGYDGTPRNYLTAIAAHETAHQWWYSNVGNDQAREPWLDEALCIYSELIYYQAAYPGLEDWWWNFRVERFRPTGWVNASVYDFDDFRAYVNAVYLRGALFLRGLRADMGDAAFFEFLQRYRAAQSGRVAAADDFWALLAAYNAPNLAQLRAEFFSSH